MRRRGFIDLAGSILTLAKISKLLHSIRVSIDIIPHTHTHILFLHPSRMRELENTTLTLTRTWLSIQTYSQLTDEFDFQTAGIQK